MTIVPSPEFERMEALSEAIVRLLRRQEATDRRLEDIEKALGIVRQAGRPVPPPQPEPPAPPAPEPPPLTQIEVPPPLPVAAPPPPTQPETTGLETTVGLTWVNR